MAFTLPNFPIENQQNPLAAALQGMMEGQQFSTDLQTKKLANQKASALAPYLVQGEESRIANQQAQTKNYGAQTARTNQEVENPGLNKAGLPGDIALANFYAKNSELIKALTGMKPPNGKENYNPISDLMEGVQASIARTKALSDNKSSLGAGAREEEYLVNTLQKANGWSEKTAREAKEAYKDGFTNLPDGTQLPPITQDIRDSLNRLNKYGSDTSERNQQRYANTLDTVFKVADKVVPGAFKFAGIIGKVKGGFEQAKTQFGEDSPEYRDYQKFTRQVLPALATELLRTGAANSTDSQKLLAITQANPIAWDTNPQGAMEQWNFLKSLYGSIGKTISQGGYQLRRNLQDGQEKMQNGEVTLKRDDQGNITFG